MQWQDFTSVGRNNGMIAKAKHTIIDKWPLRLKKRPGQAGARDDFENLLGSHHVGGERYVEWKRAT